MTSAASDSFRCLRKLRAAWLDCSGMCDFLSRITPANVVIVYQWTGLGYAGRAGPVPTITISLQNLQFQFVPLRGLFGDIAIPGLTTSITAEDLSSNAF